ncbi:MAG: RluA family pseudouridine synthase [Clostridia bacterium]|nr:RluA family pseudouridine synthase [Clostridia bacterium]
MDYIIQEKWNGMNIKNVIICELGYSTRALKELKFIKNGIKLNGEHAIVTQTVSKGDLLSLATEAFEATSDKLTPTPMSLPIVYEDDFIVVPNKPAGMPTHTSHGHIDDTVANGLAYKYASENKPFIFRAISRLDKDTSGILIIAKTRLAASFLSDAMKQHKIEKSYIALLEGSFERDDEGEIESYIRRANESIIFREICSEGDGGDYAKTLYKVIARCDTHTLVIASPVTGRTHQLRVHFSSLGNPIVGDGLYGSGAALSLAGLALHSYNVKFPHPNGESMELKTPVPKDFKALCCSIFGESIVKKFKDLFE